MARPAQIKIPAALVPPVPDEELPIKVDNLYDKQEALLYMPLPEDGDARGAMAILSEGQQIRLLARQGSKKLLLVGRQREVGNGGGKVVGVEVVHGDEELLGPLQESLRQALANYRMRAEMTGRHTPSEETLEQAGWSSYACGGRKTYYLEGA